MVVNLIKSYVDSNILFALVMGKKEPAQHEISIQLFEQIKKGEIYAVISPLALLEIKASLKMQSGREIQDTQQNITDKINQINQESGILYDRIFDPLMAYTRYVDVINYIDIPINLILSKAVTIMDDMRGIIKSYDYNIKYRSKNAQNRFKILGADDILHALLAKYSKCKVFLTFDEAFSELNGHEEFPDIKFKIVGKI